jgi:hypothetical protein
MLRGTVEVSSQADVLRARMREAGFTHGREARVNLRGVRLSPDTGKGDVVFFCDLEKVEVVEEMNSGDGGFLPLSVELEELYFQEHGRYDLLGVVLHSNGTLTVKADAA